MEFPSEFFHDEVREGFYISGMVKRAWAAQLDVLEVVANICKKHNIKWFADCGTLLGAVRHGGYIPWDDDLDICMLRDDYIKFNNVIRDELPKGYVWLNLNNEEEDYYEMMTRITNEHRINFDKEFLEKYHDFQYASGVDIFPLDYIAEDEEIEEERRELGNYIAAIAENLTDDDGNLDEFKEFMPKIEEVCEVKIDYSKPVKRQLYQIMEMVFSLYSDIKSKYVVLMPYWVHFKNHKYNAEYFEHTVMLPYENIEIPAPAAYDAVLTVEYGDYMKISRGGGVHGYPFFKEQEKHLKKIAPNFPFEYEFKMEDLKNDDREVKVRPKQQAKDFVTLISEAHKALVSMMRTTQYDTAISIIQACQDSAIQIGTLLEDSYGQGYETVSILEEYCELIYQIFELIQEASSTGAAINVDEIEEILLVETGNINASVENIVQKKEILFMPVKASDWKALDSVWRECVADENNDVKVMPIPYFTRGALGGLREEFYDGDKFPEYLNIINYKEYSLKKKHPDVIYVQNANDQVNYTMSILPEYFLANIKKYTDKLIYIPWFKVDEMGPDSAKARVTMEFYCKVPGMSHADEIIVQSEATRKEYVEYLTKFAGEETRSIWERKIIAGGSPIDEYVKNIDRKEIKNEIIKNMDEKLKNVCVRSDGTQKKIIFYKITIASFIVNGLTLLEKMEKNNKVFEKYSNEIAVLWQLSNELRIIIAKLKPNLIHKYDRIIREFEENDNCQIVSDHEVDDLIQLCDAYYGDSDWVAHRFSYNLKPIVSIEYKM